MVDTAIAQQYQIDDCEHNLEDTDIKEMERRDNLGYIETHIVMLVGVWKRLEEECRFGEGERSVEELWEMGGGLRIGAPYACK